MKILHVAQDADAARVHARVMRAIAEDVALTWVGSPVDAIGWLRQNTDTAIVIVEVEAQSCAAFVREIRAAHVNTPVVIVDGSSRPDGAVAALNSGADGYLLASGALDQELPEVAVRAMDRARSRALEHAQVTAALAAQAGELSRANRLCTALQERALQLEEALGRVEHRRAEQAAIFAELLQARQNTFAEHLAQVSESRDVLLAEYSAAMSALDREREARAADADAASEARGTLEQTVAMLHVALDDSERRHADEIAAAAATCARSEHRAHHIIAAALTREAELVAELEIESGSRAIAENQAAAARMARARGRDRSLLVASNYRRHARAARLDLHMQLVAGRAQADQDRIAISQTMAQLSQEHESLRRLYATQEGRLHGLRALLDDERKAHDLTRSVGKSELQRLTAGRERLQHSFDGLQAAFRQREHVIGDQAAARLRLEALVAERERQLTEETEAHRIATANAQHVVAHLQDQLRQAFERREAEAARADGDIEALRREVEAGRTRTEALRGLAQRVPDLVAQLDRSHHERRRQFERAPFGLCHCAADGTIVDANHSFVALLGYRRAEDLKRVSWLTAARERTGDLGWLLARAQATRKAETVETQWDTREGRRVIVRLQALAAHDGAIDVIAEDITAVRTLEARLRQAQKMEAVGRLAPEIAVTCETLLGDVVCEMQQWAGRAETERQRIPAGRILEDLARARGFLQRLGSYGDEQKRALEPVSVQQVLRDLAPVLKRLVGERIDLVLPRSAGVFPVDVDVERLERVLTNVAGYARQRLPMGGQVKIDLATLAIGRRFAAGHSNVRAGDHVLIAVTEVPSGVAGQGDVPRKTGPADPAGMELGVLMELISSCGGHLWLEAQPAGNMVIKIHLPKPAAEQGRGKRLPRWLRAASAVGIFA